MFNIRSVFGVCLIYFGLFSNTVIASDVGIFKVTKESYSVTDNLGSICQQEFGTSMQLADWNDVKTAYNNGIRSDYILE